MIANAPPPARRPAIVAPVSRHLAVADTARSLAFYRDTLGFELAPPRKGTDAAADVEIVYGPARIQLGVHDDAHDSTGERRRRGAAILFFETDDVMAMCAAIRARGGTPTEPEKVNWIKMRMFQLTDPDGHMLWFGQSFHESYAEERIPAGRGQLRAVLPELPVDDVAKAVAHYRDVLGFTVNYEQDDLGVMDRDAVQLLLIARDARHTGIGSCGFYVRDADALHAELVAKGAKVLGPPVSEPWGLRHFSVLDPEGNRLTFSQTFE